MANPFHRRELSGPLAAIAKRLQCLMHMSHSHPISQHFLLRATISHSCTLQEIEHPYPTQAMSHICLVSPAATSSVALPKIIAVKWRAPSPSYSFPYLESSAGYHPCPLRHQEVKILANADGLRLSNTTTRVQCPSVEIKIYCSTTLHWYVGVLSVGCFGFGFYTTAGVNVDVEPVSEPMLRSRLNVPFNFCTSLHPKDKVSEQSTMTMCKMVYTYLRSLEDAPDGNVIVIVVV